MAGKIIARGNNGMRDVFEEIFTLQGLEPVDPSESARRNMRTLKRRFYKEVEVRDDRRASRSRSMGIR